MAVLFVSHASADDAAVRDVEAWLDAKGFTDRFVDHSGIVAGEKWANRLRDEAASCRVVLCFVSDNWLGSDECFGEFKAAWYMGKRIVPLFAPSPGGTTRPGRLERGLRGGGALAKVVRPIEIEFLWRPQLRDPDDEMAPEAMRAR